MTLDNIELEVRAEHQRQEEKWGQQNHRDGTGEQYRSVADAAKKACDVHAKEGNLVYLDILREEFWEAAAESDEQKLRTELIQVAAVCKAWIECIDRRTVGSI